MAKILIIGAAGFLGSHFTDQMLADGHRVTGVNNFITGDRRNLAHLYNEPRFDLIGHDITLARSLLGYAPKWTLADGLAKTIEFFRGLPQVIF